LPGPGFGPHIVPHGRQRGQPAPGAVSDLSATLGGDRHLRVPGVLGWLALAVQLQDHCVDQEGSAFTDDRASAVQRPYPAAGIVDRFGIDLNPLGQAGEVSFRSPG
jgi:hypothetical protein